MHALLGLVTPWDPLHNDGYQFWSGIGSGSPILVAVAVYLRHHNCGSPRCWRIGRHPTADGLHRLCRRHHPDFRGRHMSLREIHQRHYDASH